MKKRMLLLIVLLMSIGFAAIATNLFINGQTTIAPNQGDFDVYFSDAYVNDLKDLSVITSDRVIEFTTTFEKLGQKYILDYEVTNGSKNYDAELIMSCTSSSEYLTVTNEFDDENILLARDYRTGKLTLELTKSNAGEDVEVTITCTINANAVERTSLGTRNPSDITVEAIDQDSSEDLNAVSYEFTRAEELTLLTSLKENDLIETEADVDAIIDVNSDDFDNTAITTFDVSSITEDGDSVEVLHYDEINNKWEYISEEVVEESGLITVNFNSFSPVAFLVTKSSEIECEYEIGQVWNYNYTGKEVEFIIPCNGIYKLETWGAQGGSGSSTYIGGYGAYSVGNIKMYRNKRLYINVGQQGQGYESATNKVYGTWYFTLPYNDGGGGSYWYSSGITYYSVSAAGGGATHIAKVSGNLNNIEEKDKSIYILAAGGGGGDYYYTYSGDRFFHYGVGGHAGGIQGNSGTSGGNYLSDSYYGTGGTQKSNGSNSNDADFVQDSQDAGYGAGYYHGGYGHRAGGGGGSSYIGNPKLIEKAMYCYSCKTSEDIDTKTISVKTVSDSATANTPKKGNGYARITYLGTN